MNLNDKRLMSTSEAAERWGFKSDSTIRNRVKEFPGGTIRKFGKSWVVSEEGMIKVFGKPKGEKNHGKNT